LISLGKSPPPFIGGPLTYHLPIQEDEPPPPPEEEEEAPEPADPHLTPRQRYLLRRAREESERDKPSSDSR
jgi:hypothetical protein